MKVAGEHIYSSREKTRSPPLNDSPAVISYILQDNSQHPQRRFQGFS